MVHCCLIYNHMELSAWYLLDAYGSIVNQTVCCDVYNVQWENKASDSGLCNFAEKQKCDDTQAIKESEHFKSINKITIHKNQQEVNVIKLVTYLKLGRIIYLQLDKRQEQEKIRKMYIYKGVYIKGLNTSFRRTKPK